MEEKNCHICLNSKGCKEFERAYKIHGAENISRNENNKPENIRYIFKVIANNCVKYEQKEITNN